MTDFHSATSDAESMPRSESKGQIKGHFKIFLGYFSFMLSFAFTLSFCICFRVDIHSVTSYFKVQYPRVGLEVIAGAIHALIALFLVSIKTNVISSILILI